MTPTRMAIFIPAISMHFDLGIKVTLYEIEATLNMRPAQTPTTGPRSTLSRNPSAPITLVRVSSVGFPSSLRAR